MTHNFNFLHKWALSKDIRFSELRLIVAASKYTLNPDGLIHIFSISGDRLIIRITKNKDGKIIEEREWVKNHEFSKKFTLDSNLIQYHKLPDNPKIKSELYPFTVKEGRSKGSYNRCWECRQLFPSSLAQEHFCKDCKKEKARDRVYFRRINEKKLRWVKDGLSSDEITQCLNVEFSRHYKKNDDGMIKCSHCERSFPGVRAKYCNACKVALWREKQKK
jgi:hypothetical protein